MTIYKDVVAAVGNTPLIKLKRASEMTGCEIYGKAEFMNPGQSVKDRPGKQMIIEAEKRGDLKPGGLVVEGTAGNTGIGIAVVASARGYRTVIVMPDTQSQEKKDMLRLFGAQLIEVPMLPYSDPNNYQHVARRLADQLRKTESNGVLFADQWNNLDNPKAHYVSTGPEIWEQTGGNVDAFICSVGSGGTLAGTSAFLREKKKDIVIGLADPHGAGMYSLFTTGEAKASPGNSITEGIGLGRVTPIVKDMKRSRSFSICSSTKGCAWAARPPSTSPAPSVWRSSSARAKPSSRSWPTTATAISRSCSIRSSCARRTCPCRLGWRSARISIFPSRRSKRRRNSR
jgi:cysteine synthase A